MSLYRGYFTPNGLDPFGLQEKGRYVPNTGGIGGWGAVATSGTHLPDGVVVRKKETGGWVYQIDDDFGPNDEVPAEAIIGAWEVNDSGELTGVYKANPNYLPKTQSS